MKVQTERPSAEGRRRGVGGMSLKTKAKPTPPPSSNQTHKEAELCLLV